MFVRLRSARPTNDLAALRRFYVDALGCRAVAEWVDHQGFDGLVIDDGSGAWQVEFVVDRARPAPPVPSHEHLLVFYVADRAALAARTAAMDAASGRRVAPNNPYWARCGVTYADPDGYCVVIALAPES
ncbi:MAG TPA: VOC family protein [Methylibium sp.]|nr:VOC family protein [Methylibium sp.]